MISIVVPTVKGREHHLKKCLKAYEETTDDYEIHVLLDRPACGQAWVEGAEVATGDYLHFSADDLEPFPGWWQAAMYTADAGVLPAPRILNTDGTLQTCGGQDGFEERPTGYSTDFSRIPFMTRAQWEQIAPIVSDFLCSTHYFTDNAISWAGWQQRIPTAVHREYQFTHHFAQEKRGAGMTERDRMIHDHALFQALINS